jgi:predicted TIM-barrel fold metal-dependent hydrolase
MMNDLNRAAFLGAAAASIIATEPLMTSAQSRNRIDVHHHYASPEWETTLRAKNLLAPVWKGWTPDRAIEVMDRNGVRKSMLSVTTPGIWFGDDAAARVLARSCNDYAAQMIADHHDRFGMFVALPLPDIAGSLREIAYGMDTLKADGVGLLTSYTDKWLGDPYFSPIFDELNNRRAIVFVHPTTAKCCTGVLSGVPDSAIEYGTDTTRAISQLIFSGWTIRYPNIRMIFSHGGGTMPFLIDRFVHLADRDPRYQKLLPNGFLPEARKYYYDTAQVSNAAAMSALMKLIPLSHVLFGTDYPYLSIEENVDGLKQCGVFAARDLATLDSRNASDLFASAGMRL